MRNPYTPDCSIKGCTRAAGKGYLCRMHYAMIPPELSGYLVASQVMLAAYRAADKLHKDQLAAVRKVLATRGTEAS
jgi:hypothetical protein